MRSIRFAWAPLVFGGVLMFGATSAVRADDDCQKRTIKADHNLHEAIEKHGPDSPQAQNWRTELAEARSYCYEHNHRW